MGPVSPQKKTTATTKEGLSLVVEVQAKLYCGLKTKSKKFRKYRQVENTAVHLQNTPTYYVKYGKEEDRIKALIGLILEENWQESSTSYNKRKHGSSKEAYTNGSKSTGRKVGFAAYSQTPPEEGLFQKKPPFTQLK